MMSDGVMSFGGVAFHPLSFVLHAREFPAPRAQEAEDNGCGDVEGCDPDVTAFDEDEGFEAEGRERGESAEEAGDQEDAGFGREVSAALGEAGEQADGEAAEYVFEEGTERESPVWRDGEREGGEEVAGCGAEEAAGANEEYTRHKGLCLVDVLARRWLARWCRSRAVSALRQQRRSASFRLSGLRGASL